MRNEDIFSDIPNFSFLLSQNRIKEIYMKRIYTTLLSLMVVCGVFFCCAVGVAAENKAVDEVMGWEIMVGDENGDFRPDDKVSRAEFCAVILRCLGYDDGIGIEYNNKFTDIDKSHWAYESINTLYELGMVNGVDENTFNPDGTITDEQAAKMLVSALGYTIVAEEAGGYPLGYMNVASGKGLLKGIYIDSEKTMTREEVAVLIYNALDVPMLVQNLSDSLEYDVNSDMTIKKIRAELTDREKIKGIVTGGGVTFLSGEDRERNKYVEIDGELYFSGNKDYSEYIGMEVWCYYDHPSDERVATVYKIVPTSKNKAMTLTSGDIISADIKNGVIGYEKEDSSRKNVYLSDGVKFIYNGRYEYTLENDSLTKGFTDIKLIENNGDSGYDYVFINSYEFFIVDKLTTSGDVLILKNERKNGATSYVFNDEDEYVYTVIKNNEVCEITDIKADDVLRVRISLDKKYTIMEIIEVDKISGTVTNVNSEELEIGIDGEIYEYMIVNSMSHIDELILGDSFSFLLDENRRIIYFVEDLRGKSQLCYYIETRLFDEFTGQKMVKVVTNNNVMRYPVSESVKIDDEKYDSEALESVLNNGRVYKIAFNSKNEVKEFETVERSLARADRRYNKKYNSIRDIFKPFRADDNTVIYMIPTNKATCDEDYLTTPDIKNNAFVECEAYEIDEETQIAKAIVIYGAFAYEEDGEIVKSSKASIVDGVKKVYSDETGETTVYVRVYQYGNYLEIPVKDEASIENKAMKLKTGDVIFYSTNTIGKLDNIEIIATDIMNMKVGKNGFTDDKGKMYGYVSRCKKNWMKNNSNILSDILYLSLSKTGIDEEPFVLETEVENEVDTPIYCIDKGLMTVYPITADEILSLEEAGDACDMAFVYSINSAAQVVVVVKS